MPRKIIERRRRGLVGFVTLTFFWICNGFMVLWFAFVVKDWAILSSQLVTSAEKAGSGIGIVIGLGTIFSLWALVLAVTSVLVLMTRGRKEIIETDT